MAFELSKSVPLLRTLGNAVRPFMDEDNRSHACIQKACKEAMSCTLPFSAMGYRFLLFCYFCLLVFYLFQPVDAASAGADVYVVWSQEHLEQKHTEIPPAAIFVTPLTDFDALVVLREEALPYPDRAIPGSTQGLPSISAEGGEEDGFSCHKKARARLHSIPKGTQQSHRF